MMKKKLINKKGITLIALVITIIVLLILAGVTIATLTGDNGVLTRANDASRETEISSVKEQAQLDIENWVAEELENGRDGIINDWEQIKTILDSANPDTENRYYEEVTAEGVKTVNGYIVPIEELYSNNSGEISTGKTIEDLKVGEKVNYIDKNNVTRECIVLYDSSSEYGVQIITADVVENTVTLGSSDFNTSRDSYNNALKTLYDEAQKYLNTTYATSSRCVGSDPADPDWDTITNEAGYYTKEIAEEQNEYQSFLDSYYGIFKNNDEKYNTDWTQMGSIANVDIKIASSVYWMASRSVEPNSLGCGFDMRHVTSDGLFSDSLYFVNSDFAFGRSKSRGFRPVFTLKSEIKVTGGDGVNTPYTLAP